MSNIELEHLIKMANELSANLARGDEDDEVAVRVADHLRRFWAPAMRARIIHYLENEGEKLVSACQIAVARLAEEAREG